MNIALLANPSQKEDLNYWIGQISANFNPDLLTYDADLIIDWNSTLPMVTDRLGRKLCIDFDNDHLTYERKQLRGGKEPLAKALGVHKGIRKVLDLSVGLASDSVLLSQLGCQVQGVERSPLLHFLLSQAFKNTERNELKNYQLHFASALDFLEAHKGQHDFEAIYFDPMYPKSSTKKKTALPKQEMVIFRDLVGDDQDAAQVLLAALNFGVSRIVVKRPIGGAILGESLGLKPNHSLETKVVRFDIYIGR